MAVEFSVHSGSAAHAMSNPSGILPNLARITAASHAPVSGAMRRKKATAPTTLSSFSISSARWIVNSASGHVIAGPGLKPLRSRRNDTATNRSDVAVGVTGSTPKLGSRGSGLMASAHNCHPSGSLTLRARHSASWRFRSRAPPGVGIASLSRPVLLGRERDGLAASGARRRRLSRIAGARRYSISSALIM